MVHITDLIQDVIEKYDIAAVFIEDIQLRVNVASFKKLAQLQGALVSHFERNEYLYDFIAPAKWQGFCNARARNSKEKKNSENNILNSSTKKASKILSIQFVKEQYQILTDDDNLADAICIGHFVVNNIKIIEHKGEEK